MIPLLPILLLGLAYILHDGDEKPVKSNSKEENGNEINGKTGSDHRGGHRRGVSSTANSERRHRRVKKPADSVDTVGEEINQEDYDHASRQTTKNTDDNPVQCGEPGTETAKPGDAVSTTETST